jgi:hypothetical protein
MKIIGLFNLTSAALILSAVACGSSSGTVGTEGQAESAEACSVATDCTGFLPRNVEQCSDGTTAGASWTCVKDKCEIAYCSASTAGNGGCNTASDCTGLLPRNVVQCANGTSAGASWSCVESQCEVAYCSAAAEAVTDAGAGPSPDSGFSEDGF